jgi:hypothetical protein
MRTLKTAMGPQSRAGGVRTFHPDILLHLLNVFARIERRPQERLQSTCADDKH